MEDVCLTILFIWLILIAITFLLIFIERRPKVLCTVPDQDVLSYRQKMLNTLRGKGYIVEKKRKDKIFVQKDAFSATTLTIRQNKQKVEILYIPSNSLPILIVIIASLFTIWIIAIVIAAIADGKSNKFRNNELLPILTGYGRPGRVCPNCGRPIPWDSKICPYCGKEFKNKFKD